MATRNDYSCSESAVTFWATLTLAVMAVTSLLLRYITDPVTCQTPAEFTHAYVEFAKQMCFKTQTIYTMPTPNVDSTTPAPREEFTYHQWVPFFLGACALLCLLPHFLWRMFSAFLWFDPHTVIQTIARNQTNTSRHVILRDLALVMQAGLKEGNSGLTLAIMARKAVVVGVCFVQTVLTAAVFAPQLSGSKESEEEQEREEQEQDGDHRDNSTIITPLPVKEFLCIYEIVVYGNRHAYTVLCTMPLAQVYSKGLAFLFYLFLVLFVLCALDMALWAGRLLVPSLRDVSLRRYLAVNRSENGSQGSFLRSIGPDGRLLLAVVGDCCGPLAATDLTNHLLAVFEATPCTYSASPPSTVGPAPSGSAGATPDTVPSVTIADKDGGDSAAADGEKEKPC